MTFWKSVGGLEAGSATLKTDAVPGRKSDLRLLLWQLHIVEDAEDDPEEILPPVPLKGVSVALHDLEHDREASVKGRHTRFKCHCSQHKIRPGKGD